MYRMYVCVFEFGLMLAPESTLCILRTGQPSLQSLEKDKMTFRLHSLLQHYILFVHWELVIE